MSKRIAVKRPHRRANSAAVKKFMRNDQNAEEQLLRQMYMATEHWLGDTEFFNDELAFFCGLVDKHYMAFIEEHNLARTRGLASRLSEIEKKNSALEQDIQTHLNRLADVIETPFSHDAQACKDEHRKLETRMTDFVKEFRSVKQETFALGKIVIGSEKGRHLLNP